MFSWTVSSSPRELSSAYGVDAVGEERPGYGPPLLSRVSERLRVKDINFDAPSIIVRAGKGDKDRPTLFPEVLREPLAQHLARAHRLHARDVEAGAGWVELPGALAAKYPTAGREWAWQWVFPATRPYIETTTGQRRRHHLHESVLQHAVHDAVRLAGVPKPASCHTFRHYPERGIRGIHSPRTSSRTVTASAPCNSSSAIPTCARR